MCETDLTFPTVRDRWVAALRSGNYEQATGQLKVESDEFGDSYCCLGVLAEMLDPERREWGPEDENLTDLEVELDNSLRGYSEVEGDLIDMNDSGSTFLEIADEIEKRFGG